MSLFLLFSELFSLFQNEIPLVLHNAHVFISLLLICASSCFLKKSLAAVIISGIFPSFSRLKAAQISFLSVLRTAYFPLTMPLG